MNNRYLMLLVFTISTAACDSTVEGGGDTGGGGKAPEAVCTPGMDQTCNDNLSTSSLHGVCKPDGTCECQPQFPKNPATGRCQ